MCACASIQKREVSIWPILLAVCSFLRLLSIFQMQSSAKYVVNWRMLAAASSDHRLVSIPRHQLLLLVDERLTLRERHDIAVSLLEFLLFFLLLFFICLSGGRNSFLFLAELLLLLCRRFDYLSFRASADFYSPTDFRWSAILYISIYNLNHFFFCSCCFFFFPFLFLFGY